MKHNPAFGRNQKRETTKLTKHAKRRGPRMGTDGHGYEGSIHFSIRVIGVIRGLVRCRLTRIQDNYNRFFPVISAGGLTPNWARIVGARSSSAGLSDRIGRLHNSTPGTNVESTQ